MNERPLAETLGEFAVGFDLASTSKRAALLERAQLHILDGIGVALGSSCADDGYAEKLIRAAMQLGASSECTIIGFSQRASAPVAAFLNGALVHGCEFDDTFVEKTVHTEPFAVPVALALAEKLQMRGDAFAEGWVVAAEVGLRAACACNQEDLSGFHMTSLFGVIGAAAAAARMLGLSADQAGTAIALSVSFASGTKAGWSEGSGRNKPIQPGWAAMSGLTAALMAAEGYECAHTTLDGPSGLYASHAWQQGWSVESATRDLGFEWKCLNIDFKLYPAGTLVQTVLDCTRALVFEHDIRPGEVEKIEVAVPSQWAFRFRDGRYDTRFYRAASAYGMHGSWPLNVARMILSRDVGLKHLTYAGVSDPDLLEVADRVTCVVSETDGGLPVDERPTSVRIVTDRGSFETTRVRSLGHPSEVRRKQIVDKFRGNAQMVLSPVRVDAVAELVLNLGTVADVRDIARLLATPEPSAGVASPALT